MVPYFDGYDPNCLAINLSAVPTSQPERTVSEVLLELLEYQSFRESVDFFTHRLRLKGIKKKRTSLSYLWVAQCF